MDVEVYTEFGPDGRQVGCSVSHGAVCIWDENLVAKETFCTKEKGLRLVRWSLFPDFLGRDCLATLSIAGRVAIWIREETCFIERQCLHDENPKVQVQDLAFGPAVVGAILGLALTDGTIRIYAYSTFNKFWDLISTLTHGKSCTALSWDLTTTGALVTAAQNQLKIWRRDQTVEWFLDDIRQFDFDKEEDQIIHIAWSPREINPPLFALITSNKLLLSFDNNNTLTLYDSPSDILLRLITFNNTGSLLCLIDSARITRVWKRDFYGNWTLLRTYDPPPLPTTTNNMMLLTSPPHTHTTTQ